MKRIFFLSWGLVMMMQTIVLHAGDSMYALRIVSAFKCDEKGMIPLVEHYQEREQLLNPLYKIIKKHDGAVIKEIDKDPFECMVYPYTEKLLNDVMEHVKLRRIKSIEVVQKS